MLRPATSTCRSAAPWCRPGRTRAPPRLRRPPAPARPAAIVKKINKKLCPSDEPQGRGWLFGVSHIDQSGDPDSTFCAAGDMTTCPIGLHDKRRAPDEIDPAGHNVDSSLGGSTAYDLRAHAEMLGADTVRAWASNPSTATSSGEKAHDQGMAAGRYDGA